MSFNGCMNNCPKHLTIRERYEKMVPYKKDFELFKSLESLNPGDTLEHEQWQDIIMACKIIAEKNNYFEDFYDDLIFTKEKMVETLAKSGIPLEMAEEAIFPKHLKKRYERIAYSNEFKRDYQDKSLGETSYIDK